MSGGGYGLFDNSEILFFILVFLFLFWGFGGYGYGYPKK
ncbi:MAG: hypothetical protein PWR27_903 [Petroclostridium sp.]|jgi:hypothetical protein|nr:hypothetical protein [Clostridia bacterium]MDK2810194.1 hypothetical protein [Petroclostridium sp.]